MIGGQATVGGRPAKPAETVSHTYTSSLGSFSLRLGPRGTEANPGVLLSLDPDTANSPPGLLGNQREPPQADLGPAFKCAVC